jgi:hypothetical protein
MLKRVLSVVVIVAGAMACSESVTPPVHAPETFGGARASATGLTTFHSQQFVRTTGAPNQYSVAVATAGFQAPFEIQIRNGSTSGAHRISSGTVKVDGDILLSPSDFSQQAAEWAFPASLGASATIEVSLASKPGSFIEITIAGTPAATLFCPTGGPGAYLDLSDAVAATPPGGTILVCDGFWDLDQEVIDRPLTLRSQNPGGATLSDSDPGPANQSSDPGIIVDGYVSGTVRFVDLSFNVKGRMIVPQGTYDRVEVDSTHWLGTDPGGILFMPFNSTVPTAYVEVRNSHFDGGGIAVFPVHGIEADVHHNVFENQRLSSVIHSGNAGFSGLPHAHGRVTDNLFRHCGPNQCLRSFASNVVIARNRIEAPLGPSRFAGGIQVDRQPLHATVLNSIVVEDNEVIGGALPGVPSSPTSWTLQVGIRIIEPSGAPTPVIRRNRVTAAHTLAQVASTGGIFTDNTFDTGFRLGTVLGPTVWTFNRNDVVNVMQHLQESINPASDFRCNWWGSAAGPVAPHPAIPPAQYTPWATTAIANQPSVVCP